MVEQLALNLEAPTDALQPRRAALLAKLKGNGWITARRLQEAGFSDRELREIVESDHEGDIFSHPGSRGYKFFDEVEEGEFMRCTSLKSQGEKMVARFMVYLRRHHRGRQQQ